MLHLVATPIGNLSDMPPRALEALRGASVVACEDTRRTWQLLAHFGIPRPEMMLSYREGQERSAGEKILRLLREGRDVALCTDAGMPCVSDPGFRLVRDAVAEGIPVTVEPGPCAAVAALVLSGLPTSSWTFLGFPPRKPGPERRFFEAESESVHTLIFYESPFRIGKTLEAAAQVLGADRQAAVCLEITKKFERVERGTLDALAKKFLAFPPKGEIVVVVAGKQREKHSAGDGTDEPD